MKKLILFLVLFSAFYAEAQQRPSDTIVDQIKPPVLNNDISIDDNLQEFYDSARYYRVAVIGSMDKLSAVYYREGDLNFLGDISPDGTKIILNKELLKYPNLAKVILFRQFGKLYELETDKKGHMIMGDHWEIDYHHEYYATTLWLRPYMKKYFFEALSEKAPIEKKL
jgi:hypothetical protein